MSIAIAAIMAGTIALSGTALPTGLTDLDPGAGLDEIQHAADRATDNRIRALEEALEKVEANEHLTDAHSSEISATLQADLDAMHELQTAIADEDTAAEALDAYRSIFTDYRVYAVAIPQSRYAAAADALTDSALPRLQEAHDGLAEVADGDAEIEAALAEMQASIDEAAGLLDGLADASLAVTPADFNADEDVLDEIREALRDARDAARDAREDARRILDDLR
jgi:chromosome segregation ATPase